MGSVVLCLFLLALMPDPRKSGQGRSSMDPLGPENNTHESGDQPQTSTKATSVDSLISALSNRNVLLTVPVFLVGIFRYTTLNVLIQYASVRFGLKISTGATFYTETAIVNIFLFLFMIPQLTSHIRLKYNVRPQTIDLFLVRTSVTLMCIGCLAIGLAQSGQLLPIGKSNPSLDRDPSSSILGVFIFAAGFGSRVSALALISYWISDNSKATLYAAIVVLESLGHAIGDPSMQQIFAASLKLSPFWQAMPFFVAAVSDVLFRML